MKTILKFGLIFTAIYLGVLLFVTLFYAFSPIEVSYLVPLWIIYVKEEISVLVFNPLFDSSLKFRMLIAFSQACTAFVQGMLVGAGVWLYKKSSLYRGTTDKGI
ncbi:MAG: hypothetical protein NT098_05200 [Candidatus Parcubacteria bacterium]|nr:hypothetical protein [Candidatus Parcubacteria bacterium]